MINMFPASQLAADVGGAVHRHLHKWISELAKFTNQTTVPPKGIVMCNLSAQDVADYFDATGLGLVRKLYEGWAICNGSNGTPSLDGKFPRFEVASAGTTGGSDSASHTHAIDHDHGSFTSGAGSAHTHSVGLTADATYTGDSKVLTDGATEVHMTGESTAPGSRMLYEISNAGAAWTSNYASSMTSESAHTHSTDVPALTGTSGAASASDNRPAYFELVPLMRLGSA